MKLILVDSNLVCTFFGKRFFFILIMVHTFENNYFLVRTKLGYLRYYMVQHISHLYSLQSERSYNFLEVKISEH